MKFKPVLSLIFAAAFCCSAEADLCEKFCHGRGYVGADLFIQNISANWASFRDLHPRFALGYADWSNQYYLGGEVFYIPATLVLSDIRGNREGSTAKASNSFGASLLPGAFLYNNLLGYLHLGLIDSRFVAPNSMKLGMQLGCGLQTKFREQWAFRAEYIYTAYSSVVKIGTPNSNELGVGVVYFFEP